MNYRTPTQLVYGSVCSGIEAATVVWHPLGWRAAFYSEIDDFPRAVLRHHYPAVPLHSDFTTIEAEQYGPIDLLVGGTPCQSFSIAGLRKGLDDDRGNLALEYLRLAQRKRPQWLVWENVPGVLSSNEGRDFGAFLGSLVQLGYGFAYRVLDAQYFGVPQRRRRVFVVGYFGDWRPAAAVLFERHSLQGHPAPSREKRKDVAPTISARPTGGGGLGTDFDLDGGCVVTSPTLRAGGNKTGGDRPPGTDVDTADSLICVSVSIRGRKGGATAELGDEVGNCLRASSGGGDKPYVMTAMQVRRLTPRECERLQGFPDNYTKIPIGKKTAEQCPDGPRYKALGNSMAVPVMHWIGMRIDIVRAALTTPARKQAS